MVDSVFIYLEFMELGIDFTEMERMCFLATLATGNGFKVKRFFRLRIERFKSFGKLLIRFFVVGLFGFGVKLFLVFMG